MSDRAPVRQADQLDWARIADHLRARLPELCAGPLAGVEQFTNGAANLTYLLRFGPRDLVLRRPPFGSIPPGAHDMRREWRVLSKLWRHFDRAPRAFLFCDDHAVAGADFFVMEHRDGAVVRGEIPAELAAQRDAGRRLGLALVDAMADLHRLEPAQAEMADLGRPEGFVARQVSGWRRRWELAEPLARDDVKAPMADVAERLARTLPRPPRASIVHNDLKLDNCQFDPRDPDRVQSIFDWDMTTLGEPMIDLGTLLNYWPDPSDPPNAGRVSHQGLLAMGLPTRAEIVARYTERTGIDTSAARWYEAFAQWKTGVVIQQLHRRWEKGESTDPRMATIADRLPLLATTASRLLDELGVAPA